MSRRKSVRWRSQRKKQRIAAERAHFEKTGKPSEWLIKACLRNESLGRKVFPLMYPKTELEYPTLGYYRDTIKAEMSKPSVLYSRITNLEVPSDF